MSVIGDMPSRVGPTSSSGTLKGRAVAWCAVLLGMSGRSLRKQVLAHQEVGVTWWIVDLTSVDGVSEPLVELGCLKLPGVELGPPTLASTGLVLDCGEQFTSQALSASAGVHPHRVYGQPAPYVHGATGTPAEKLTSLVYGVCLHRLSPQVVSLETTTNRVRGSLVVRYESISQAIFEQLTCADVDLPSHLANLAEGSTAGQSI